MISASTENNVVSDLTPVSRHEETLSRILVLGPCASAVGGPDQIVRARHEDVAVRAPAARGGPRGHYPRLEDTVRLPRGYRADRARGGTRLPGLRTSQQIFEVGGLTDEFMTEVDPECVIGATAYPSYVAAIYAGERPLWADIFGSFLAEAQAKAAVYAGRLLRRPLPHVNSQLLVAADCYSTVSTRQSYELVGQLGTFGRLNMKTLGYDFARSIPCGVIDREFPAPAYPARRHRPGRFHRPVERRLQHLDRRPHAVRGARAWRCRPPTASTLCPPAPR